MQLFFADPLRYILLFHFDLGTIKLFPETKAASLNLDFSQISLKQI